MIGGLSFVNYGDYLDQKTLQKLAGSGAVSIVSGALATSLKTRQLADPLRVQISGRTGDACTFSFDITQPTAPNEFGQAAVDLRNIGCFGLFGIVGVQFNNQTVYPQPALLGMSAQLKGYTAAAPTTGLVFTSAATTIGELSYQSSSLVTSMPNSMFAQTPASIFCVLDNNVGLSDYTGQGWGGQVIGSKPRSFRLEITVAPDTGTTIIDLGRFWLGNAFRPVGGVADVSFNMYDPSQLVLSRDNQGYPTYFNRARQMSFKFPVLTELEALGIGTSPRAVDNGDNNNYASANCYMQAMYALGITKECVAWTQDYTLINAAVGNVGGLLMARTSMYGRVTQWQPLSWLQARKVTRGTQGARRVWTGGLTMQEER